MKKNLFLILSILVSSHVFGQFKIGVKAGMNITNSKFTGTQYSNRIGYHSGFVTEIKLGKLFLLRPELIHSLKGFGYPPAGRSGAGRLGMHYINMPVLFGVKPIELFSVYAGPELGYLIKAVSRFDNTVYNSTPHLQRMDLGISAGTCFYLGTKLAIEARYIYGFKLLTKSTITDENGGLISNNVRDGSNRTIQLSLNYYPFWKKVLEKALE